MNENEIQDDEIQILGSEYRKPKMTKYSKMAENLEMLEYSKMPAPSGKNRRWIAWLLIVVAMIIAGIVFVIFQHLKSKQPIETKPVAVQLDIQPEEAVRAGYVEVNDETVNDVPLRIYTPRNSIPEISLSLPDETDSTVVFVTQAADIGADNRIVGDFILKGEVLARGVKKEGFCSIINHTLTVGVNSQTPLLQDAIREKGYFFRQYPLVSNSEAIDNKPKGKSIRRALAIRRGEILMVESRDRESFHDFAQALADLGISEAIYLMGGVSVYGWYRDEHGKQTFFGTKKENYLEVENFLVWKNAGIVPQ